MEESAVPARVGELVEGLFRREAGRMVAALVRVFGPARLELAEDVVQEALLRALREWPFRGIPDHPQGWIVRVARNRAMDLLRREATLERRVAELGVPDEGNGDAEAFFAGEVEDDALRLLFTCCHPAVPREARVALTLKAVGGFGVPEIARAFLAREDAVAQRIVRARRRIRAAGIDFAVPAPASHALAVAETAGPRAGLAAVDALRGEPALARYALLPATRGVLLERLGDRSGAAAVPPRSSGARWRSPAPPPSGARWPGAWPR